MREGDLIQGWGRGEATGVVESPFDLTEVEIEQSPLGTVTLQGQRDGKEQHWSMGLDEWGLRAGPLLCEALLKLYEEGKDRDSAGAHLEAAQRWRAAAAKSQDSAASWPGPWFLRRAAQALTLAHQKKSSEETYREAVEQASHSKPIILAQVLQSWANDCKQQNDLDCAQEHYKQSLAEREKSSEAGFGSAVSLQGLGQVFEQQENFALAEEYYNRAMAIREQLAPDSLPVANSLSDMGLLSFKRGDLVHAEEYARRALAIQEKLTPESLPVASSLSNLSFIFFRHGDLNHTEEYAHRALAIREKLDPESLGVATNFNSLGNVFSERGDLVKAQEFYSRSLAIREKRAPGSSEVTSSYNNLGIVFFKRGDLIRSEAYLRRALTINERLAPGSLDVAKNLDNLGIVFFNRGDLAKAEEYYSRALAIEKERAPGVLNVAETLDNLGEVVFQRGDLSRAEKYQRQALAMMEKGAPGGLRVAVGLGDLGDLIKARGDLAGAGRYYRRALAIIEKLAPESLDHAITLSSLGEVSHEGGDLVKAERYYTQALTIIEKLSPGSGREAKALAALANIHREHQQLSTAADLFSRALSAIERQTTRLGGTANDRARFRSQHVNYYEDYIDVLLAQKTPQLAFQVLERSRARSFLEILAERQLMFTGDLPAELLQARHENAAVYDRTQAQIAQLSLQRDGAQIEQLQQHLRDLETEREQIAERVRRSSPHFAALHYPQPLDLGAARAALDPGTLLLSYSVDDDRTVLFVVRPVGEEPGFSVFDLKATGKMLGKQVEDFRKLIQREGEVRAARPEVGNEAIQTRQDRLTAYERELYDLLVKPAESMIGSSERLLLIPDGPLQVLPFAALKLESGRYLVESKPLHTAVSATVYAELKRARPQTSGKRVELAAFGDPIYPPIAGVGAPGDSGHPVDGELRSAIQRGFTLSRLPFSRTEVQSIAGLFAGHDLKYLGEQATEEHAKALGKDVRYIHFATHGLLDERFPLNSSLVLTIPSQPSQGQENGLLQAWEIFEQVRLDADLVTLSACSTGLGRELNGEGLIGLTRAFQYAGARSVLASLWSVDDYRTMQLMKRFYAELHAGVSKDAALRTAQLQLLHSSAADPYYWAAFSLTGDWR